MSGTVDGGADPRLRFDEDMRCQCGGRGTVTDAGDAGDGWWLVSWWTEHRPGCPGVDLPDRAYLVDAEAFAAGDVSLPGLEAEEVRHRGLALPPWPPGRCAAWVLSAGRRCRNPALWNGLCGVHGRRP
jgi:hypothetical protein